MESVIQQVLAVLRDVFRYRWTAFAVAWGVCLVAWPIVLTLPDKYEARARVFVDPSTALRPVIQGLAIEQDINAELNLVRQSLLSRPNLQKIVAQAGLAPQPLWPAAEARLLNDLAQRRSEEHTSELQSRQYLVCRLLLEKKKKLIFTLLIKKKKKNKN